VWKYRQIISKVDALADENLDFGLDLQTESLPLMLVTSIGRIGDVSSNLEFLIIHL